MTDILNKILFISDKINGQVTRNAEEISKPVREAIASIICVHIENGDFGEAFPELCHDGHVIVGTNRELFLTKLKGYIPNLSHISYINIEIFEDVTISGLDNDVCYPINSLDILDTIQFCYEYISKATKNDYHSYLKHYHLSYPQNSKEEAKINFRQEINQLFERNGIAFELESSGNIKKYNPIVSKIIEQAYLKTIDDKFNELIDASIKKHFNREPKIRKESIAHLWDAFERIKTYYPDLGKKESIKKLLDNCATETNFRSLLEAESKQLTDIGNNFMIRHFETNKIDIIDIRQVDYLFIRLLSLIKLCVENLPRNNIIENILKPSPFGGGLGGGRGNI